MFGFGFEAKVRTALNQHFGYQAGSWQKSILSQIASTARQQGMNEFDAAIMFMMVQMNSLQGGGEDVRQFVRKHTDNVIRVMSLGCGSRDDILDLLRTIHTEHNLPFPLDASAGGSRKTFDNWLAAFKSECARWNPALRLDKHGGGLIDFMDHQPLRRAFSDGVLPGELAKSFSPQFDAATFASQKPRPESDTGSQSIEYEQIGVSLGELLDAVLDDDVANGDEGDSLDLAFTYFGYWSKDYPTSINGMGSAFLGALRGTTSGRELDELTEAKLCAAIAVTEQLINTVKEEVRLGGLILLYLLLCAQLRRCRGTADSASEEVRAGILNLKATVEKLPLRQR